MDNQFQEALKKIGSQALREAFLEKVKNGTVQLLQKNGQTLPKNFALGLNDRGDDIEIYSEDDVNPLLQIVVRQVAQKEIASTGATNGISVNENVCVKKKGSSKIASFAFYSINALLFIASVTWVFTILNSSDFRAWYASALSDASSVVASLSFSILIPTVLLATVVVCFINRRNADKQVTVSEAFWKFEVPVLFVLFVMREVALIIPLTDGLRIMVAVLAWVIVIDAFLHLFKLLPKTYWSNVFAYVTTIVSLLVIWYWILAGLVPLLILFITEIGFDFLDDIFQTLLYDPFALFFITFYFILGLTPFFLTYIVVKKAYVRLHSHNAIVNSRWSKLGTSLQLGVPMVFVLLLFVLSRAPGIGEYAEPLILAAQAENSYDMLQLRALPLLEEKAEIEKRLRNEVKKSDLYLFKSSDFKDDKFNEQYLKVVLFPLVDHDTYDTNSSTNRRTLLQGYTKVFGEEFSATRNNLIELQQVQLRSRDILANTLGTDHVVEVTVTDSYTTFVNRDQEVVLEFSLPEHAVITDLKLGSALQFQGQIAPRGAADQVYNEQVWRRVDPALLEQVGPRQYRLRVYPVPASTNRANRLRQEEVEGETQRVQFSYRVMRDAKGIPLPVFSQQYNLLTTETKHSHSINGTPAELNTNKTHLNDPLSLSALCADGISTLIPAVYTRYSSLQVGKTTVTGDCPGLSEAEVDLAGERVTFYLDTSFNSDRAEVAGILDDLRKLPSRFYEQNTVSLIYFNDQKSAPITIQSPAEIPLIEDIVLFGGAKIWNLVKFSEDGISIYLTGDVANTQTRNQTNQNYNIAGHIGFVHYGKEIPVYSNGAVSQITASSFKVYDDVAMALKTISLLQKTNDRNLLALGDYWSLNQVPFETTSTSSLSSRETGREIDAFRPIALRAELVASQAKRIVSNDSLHQQAQLNGIVTPLSSYIALVNRQQQERLNDLSAQEDRFNSERRFRVSQPTVRNPLSNGVGIGLFGSATGLDSTGLDSNIAMGQPFEANSPALDSSLSVNPTSTKLPLLLFLVVIAAMIGGTIYLVLRYRRREQEG